MAEGWRCRERLAIRPRLEAGFTSKIVGLLASSITKLAAAP
jgi:hypothetical protein